MERLLNLRPTILMLAMAMIAMFTFSSCSSDDTEEAVDVTYSMGFTTVSLSDLTELVVVEEAFKTALSVIDGVDSFTLNGLVSECDAEVAALCKVAETALSAIEFTGSFTYVVTNLNTGEVVYTFTI